MDLITLAVAQKYTRDQIAKAAVGDVDITEYVNERVDQLINGASGTFDTLGEIETAVDNKVDKVSGKGLSTNDFTNAYKTKLDSALTSKPTYTASEVGAVPTTRTVNGKALSGNISLSASDVGALPSTTTLFSGNYNDLTNKPTIPSIDGLASETYVDNKIAAMEFILNSSTEGSTKKFKITVDDTGALTAVEVVE
jgi:hypothetical protein